MTTGKEKKTPVAYSVYDGMDGWRIVFATNGAAARRMGAGELSVEFSAIESCIRKPELDQYYPGPIPDWALIDAGWKVECCNCHNYVEKGAPPKGENAEWNGGYIIPPDPEIITFQDMLFCGPVCAWNFIQSERIKNINIEALKEWGKEQVLKQFRDAENITISANASANYASDWFNLDIVFGIPETRHLGIAPLRWAWRANTTKGYAYPPLGLSCFSMQFGELMQIIRRRKGEKLAKHLLDIYEDRSPLSAFLTQESKEEIKEHLEACNILSAVKDAEGNTIVMPSKEWDA